MILLPSPSVAIFPANSNSNSFRLKPPPAPLRFLSTPLRAAASASGRELDAFTEKSGYLFQLSASEADSLVDYDIKKISAIYRRKPLILLRRLFQIGFTFGKWFGSCYIDGLTDKSDEMFQIRAAELRKILLELGPAYVKIAQAVSSRPVYQARLRRDGKVVAVKVQRPGVQAAISLDILILRYFAGVLKKARKFNSNLQAVVDEWASSLFREMDYMKEANNGLKFKKLYGDLKDVKVPEMYKEHTTRRVLMMEWIEGTKLSEVKDLYLIEVGVYCLFNQLLENGFYHADPHPGNLLRTNDGKLAYLDFGMMGEFRQELRDGFIEACLHPVNRDFEALAKDFITLGLLPPTADKQAVTKALTGVFQNAVAKGVRNISFGDLLGNLGTTMYEFKIRIPSYFFLVIRSLAVLEGIAISYDPNYKVLGSTYPWISRKVLTDNSPKLKSSLQTLLYEEGVFRIDRLESLLSESLRARTERALVKMEDKDSKLVVKQILSFTLTEKGAFVREILLQEIAKGLDALGLATVYSLSSVAAAIIPFSNFFSSSSVTREDIRNMRTLRRLMSLLSGSQENESSTLPQEVRGIVPYGNQNYSEEALLVFYQLPSVQDIMPILSAIPELPPELQRQLFLLPADLARRLISRATARTIRRAFL